MVLSQQVGPAWGWKSSGVAGSGQGMSACASWGWGGGEMLGECVSFPLETPLTVYRLTADKLTAVWAVYKAGICDWGRRCAFPGVLYEVLASSLCISQNSLIHSLVSSRQHSLIQQSIIEKLQDHKGR